MYYFSLQELFEGSVNYKECILSGSKHYVSLNNILGTLLRYLSINFY